VEAKWASTMQDGPLEKWKIFFVMIIVAVNEDSKIEKNTVAYVTLLYQKDIIFHERDFFHALNTRFVANVRDRLSLFTRP